MSSSLESSPLATMLKPISYCCSPANNSNNTAGAGNSHVTVPPPNPLTAGATIFYPQPLSHIPLSRLLFIVQQVQAEGYHVERISSFALPGQPNTNLPEQITAWANAVHLQVGFNHPHDLCVFEK